MQEAFHRRTGGIAAQRVATMESKTITTIAAEKGEGPPGDCDESRHHHPVCVQVVQHYDAQHQRIQQYVMNQ